MCTLYIKTSYEEIVEIERNTREQSSEDRWFEERGKRLTSSNFGPIVKRMRQRYPKTLMSNIKSCRSKCQKPCQWGKDKECEAIMEYAKTKKQQGNIDVCAHCGFVVTCKFKISVVGCQSRFFSVRWCRSQLIWYWGGEMPILKKRYDC